jgi:hypothetical protein
MGVMRTGLILAAVLGLAAPAQAQDVILSPTADGLVVEYRLPRPETRFAFADPGVARSDWTSRTEGVVLDGAAASSDAPVDRFSLLIRPDSTEDGRGYIALARVGEGYVLYGPALTGEGRTLSLTAQRPSDWVLTPAEAGRGYVYFGPASAVRRMPSGATAIAAPDLSPALAEAIFGAFDDATGFYTARFGPPPKPPALSATVQGVGPMEFRGDVTDTELISARFHGERWADPGADDLAGVAAFAFHETVHLWNSHFARPAEGSPWLHEGGAEYMALVGAVTKGRMTEAEARDSLSGRLTGCRRAVGARSPAAGRMVSGSAVYNCGTLIQWLADMELRRISRAPLSVFDIWKGLIDRAAAGRPDYGPEDFRAGLAPDSAVTLLLDGPAEGRWAAIEERLTGLGVRWENRPSRQDYVIAALSHLNGQACAAGSSTGFYVREGYIQLGNAATCGPLSGDAPLATVEGVDPLAQPQAMFEAVQARCAANAPVRLTRRDDGAALTVPCGKPLNAPTAYAITEAPTLAL